MEEYKKIVSMIYGNINQEALNFGIKFASLILLLSSCVVVTIIIISLWNIFKKAGEKPWKSVVPIYNFIVLYKISGISPLFLITFIMILIPQTKLIGFVIWNIVDATQKALLSRRFNKSIGFIVGMILFEYIFYPILAFGNSKIEEKAIE